MNIEKSDQAIRNMLSNQLFGKDTFMLNKVELECLESYANDYFHPEWKRVETDRGDAVEVSNVGLVRDIRTKEFYKSYTPTNADGSISYPIIGIKDKFGKQYPQTVHRLVAKAFCPNDDPEHKNQVNHINGIKTCPWYKNLEWVTASENRLHAFRTGLQAQGEDHGKAKYTNDQIRKVCELLRDHADWTFEKIGKIVGVPKHLVQDVYERNCWTQISKDYVFPKRQTHAKGENGPNNKYPLATIEKICCYLDDVCLGRNKMTHQQIAEACGVSRMVVADIASGRTWVDVAKNHIFYKKKFG